MTHPSSTRKRLASNVWSPALAVLLAFAMASCGGTKARHRDGISTTGAVPMTPTPRAALARCRQSKLLRAVCPRNVPRSLPPAKYDLADGCANAPHITIASRRCSLPVWSYETFVPLPGQTPRAQLSAWDGSAWFSPSYATMVPPPYHVHVDIEAAADSPPPPILGPSFAGAERVRHPTDALLQPRRERAVTLGMVRWYGRHGQLVLAPTGPDGGGEEAGHLIFYFIAGGVHYDISLHAWASKMRITGHGLKRSVKAPGSGAALPHVIATLKAIVGSALGQ